MFVNDSRIHVLTWYINTYWSIKVNNDRFVLPRYFMCWCLSLATIVHESYSSTVQENNPLSVSIRAIETPGLSHLT